jgi:phosphatidylinositol glycan class B
MGVTDPFTLVMIFRLFSALFAWIMITTMMFSAYRLYGNDSQRKAVVYILALLPFLPYMFVRTSSESPSSSFSMAAFGLLMLGSSPSLPDDYGYKRNYSMGLLFAAGILFGIAFEFRYQSAFLTAGFIFRLFFISIHPKKKAIAGIAVLVGGILIPVVLCTFLDSWGYGKFTIAPWNYLYQNIVLDKSSGFGTLPFYGYIGLILSRPFRRLTFFIILLAGTVLGIARNPKHPLSWAVLMFFITHSLVAHKELRFLMNILVPAIFLTVYGFYSKNGGSILSKIWNFRTSIPAKLVYMFSILVSFTYLGAADRADADIQFCKYLYRNLNTPCTIYAVNYSPFAPWSDNMEYNFYKPKGLEVVYVASIDKSLVDNIGGGGGILVVANEENTLPDSDFFNAVEIYHYELRSFYLIMKAYIKKPRNFRWTLYRVTAKSSEVKNE